ncbi:glycerol-3-phosphate 1-O-acyltransferase PlsY [Desulfobaculum bizertense]|uniref:Glycerol-3-phosphate acyltransferase n=1 Tax=Desulfobaculum bizertense DSM 18034 TaxID=1121442 RepID=A0A1T4WCQ8_9BACT|nr:glycerol-3-phosphate 1-O-acyltransferase PlsY [Desulfobaculum bizertense]UIJ37414.1 glycerol-3-phosphate 1-O-acyltransferase PlsY [Desulfobaculum bizertense]SKA74977.1 glycerol-3-phosphate acyltransferase PlsY [Desulfobaculum bizertense DSM 18034]
MLSLGWIAVTYLLGAVPFGLFVGRIFCGIDPRLDGSHNTGSTNVARLCGFRYGVLTLLFDAGKGFLPVYLASTFSDSTFFLGLVALAAVAGHVYSVFLDWKGGKAVATTVGAFLALAPGALLLSCLVFIGVVLASGFVSLGSLALVSALVLFLILSGQFGLAFFAALIAALVFYRHADNIQRLAHGTEKSWKKKKN